MGRGLPQFDNAHINKSLMRNLQNLLRNGRSRDLKFYICMMDFLFPDSLAAFCVPTAGTAWCPVEAWTERERGCVKVRFPLKTAVICKEQPLPKSQQLNDSGCSDIYEGLKLST
ncbi:hypothetical protein HMPREF9141_2302 [Prevotella multiformis DSM 16608]|uniref:Uncharacterized protein n=1 Tax=Prevotella multiformis DSM 16608 TaxID=888743 RepID=F0F9N5_9BACT|nr:hypothetical protein HMPREF9141_2302 [Prevotella multiformis DSM 16608]